MPSRPVIPDADDAQERAAAAASDAGFLAEFQKRRAAEIAEKRKAEAEARREKQRLADEERQRQWDERCRTIEEAFRETDEHHRAFGAFLKIGEAYVTKELHDRYHRKRSDRKVAPQLEKFIKAFQETRAVMDCERIRDLQTRELYGRPAAKIEAGDDVYFGDALTQLHQNAYRARTMGAVLQEFRWWHGDKAPTKEHHLLGDAIAAVVSSTRREVAMFSGMPAEPKEIADRNTKLRSALLESPDQPQAVFVARFRVHPDTVRRCRRELEEAKAIPFLAHRHGPAQRRVQLAEAADLI